MSLRPSVMSILGSQKSPAMKQCLSGSSSSCRIARSQALCKFLMLSCGNEETKVKDPRVCHPIIDFS